MQIRRLMTSSTQPKLTMKLSETADLVEHQTAVREVAGSNLDQTNTQGP